MKELFHDIPLKLDHLIGKVDSGYLGLPDLQRPFVWSDSKIRDLLDSMMRGYPIGYLMLWECPVQEATVPSARRHMAIIRHEK